MLFKVLEPLLHDGQGFEPEATVELSPAQAEPLLALAVVEVVPDQAEPKPKKKP